MEQTPSGRPDPGNLERYGKRAVRFYRVLHDQAGISRCKLVAAGNGIRKNEALQHILSDMFGLPLTVEQNEEEAALGTAISAFAMIESIYMDQWLGQHSF